MKLLRVPIPESVTASYLIPQGNPQGRSPGVIEGARTEGVGYGFRTLRPPWAVVSHGIQLRDEDKAVVGGGGGPGLFYLG